MVVEISDVHLVSRTNVILVFKRCQIQVVGQQNVDDLQYDEQRALEAEIKSKLEVCNVEKKNGSIFLKIFQKGS